MENDTTASIGELNFKLSSLAQFESFFISTMEMQWVKAQGKNISRPKLKKKNPIIELKAQGLYMNQISIQSDVV